MKRGARQSQIVNNFFSLATIIMVSVTLTLYVKYVVKKPLRIHSNLICQEEALSSFDKISNKKLFNTGYRLLIEGAYVLDGGIIPSLEKKSHIEKKLSIKQIDNIFLNTINIKSNDDKNKFLKIKYELIENEDETSEKEGSILSSFRVNNKEVFNMSIDYSSYDMIELTKQIQCTLDAFKHNAKL